MTIYRFIGDLHGKEKYIPRCTAQGIATIAVGDVGIDDVTSPYYKLPVPQGSNFSYIRGNHDNPGLVITDPHYIGNAAVAPVTFDIHIALLSGGFSTDRASRTPGKDWWEDEELSQEDFDWWMEQVRDVQPDVIVTHSAPPLVFPFIGVPSGNFRSRTDRFLDVVSYFIKPKVWIFGHYHRSADVRLNTVTGREDPNGTRFICLDEGEAVDLDSWVFNASPQGDGLTKVYFPT